MAQQTINVGTTPNDGTGDPLRTGFVKTNSNFTDLYNNKQDALVSGTNIKTINSNSVLGSGNISVQDALVSGTNIQTINGNDILTSGDLSVQETLVSGTNIRTINGNTLLASSDLAVQETLVSGTNIKTINGSSVLGSGNLTINGGLQGIHAIIPLASGDSIIPTNNSTALTTSALISNRLYAIPFMSNQSFTTSGFYINCSSLQASALARILVYSDLNGKPDQKLFESSNLDLSTTGIKTATTSFSIVAGTTYWICVHAFGTAALSHLNVPSLFPLRISGTSISAFIYGSPTFGSAPTTFSFTGYNSSPAPFIGITKA